jgi:hypothetical protein
MNEIQSEKPVAAGRACKELCNRLCGSIKHVAYLRKLHRAKQEQKLHLQRAGADFAI